jgi:hypothetical protein
MKATMNDERGMMKYSRARLSFIVHRSAFIVPSSLFAFFFTRRRVNIGPPQIFFPRALLDKPKVAVDENAFSLSFTRHHMRARVLSRRVL